MVLGPTPVALTVDYVISYLKKNGQHADKVFKLTTKSLAPGETAELAKSQAFRLMTTRVHYPGQHRVAVQVNGQRHTSISFDLKL